MSISNNVGHHNLTAFSEMLTKLQEQINEVQPFLIANKDEEIKNISRSSSPILNDNVFSSTPSPIPTVNGRVDNKGGTNRKNGTVSRRSTISKSIIINLKNKKNNTKKKTMKKIKIGKRIIINITK